jgi:hypothetical protein
MDGGYQWSVESARRNCDEWYVEHIEGLSAQKRTQGELREGGRVWEREEHLLDSRALEPLLLTGGIADQQELDILIFLQERAGEIQRVAPYATSHPGHLARIKGNSHPISLAVARSYGLMQLAQAYGASV